MSVSILCLCIVSSPVMANPLNNETTLSKKSLMSLARHFVHDLNDSLDYLDSLKNNPSRSKKRNSIPDTEIPDGEELIMEVLVGSHKLPLKFDVLTIKEKNDIFISLYDFFTAADFAITVNTDTATASGWFIREDQELFLDAHKETITIMGETFSIPPDAIQIKDDDIYIASYIISEWFNMQFIVELKDLTIFLTTSQPIPVEERFARQQRGTAGGSQNQKPKLPFFDQPYQAFTTPFVDVSLRSSYSKINGSEANIKHTWSAIGAGDVAKFTTKTFASGDDDRKLNNLRLTLSKENEDAVLLGPLNARHYSFGDISTTQLPLTGSGGQEQGIHITNNKQNEISSLNTRDFRGDAQPGWDVELHRGQRVLSFQTVTDDGRYEFNDIPLLLGSNDFKLIFYGPQGEIQEQNETITVNADQIKSGQGFYDLSLTRNNTTTLRTNDIPKPEDKSAHFVARYDVGINDTSSIHAGIRYRQENQQNKAYLETGLSTSINKTLIDIDAAYEATDNAVAFETTARRNFGSHSARGTIRLNSNNYAPGGDGVNPSNQHANLSLDGPIRSFFGLKSNYNLDSRYTHSKNGQNNITSTGNIATRIGSLTLDQSLLHQRNDNGNDDIQSIISQSMNLRGFIGKSRWRLRSSYNIKPENELQAIFASLSHPFSNDLKGLLEIEHKRTPSTTEFIGSLQVKTEKATISPRLSLDTDNDIQASVNVRFGVSQEPYSHDLSLYNHTQISSGGGVSARVFLDVNGDGKFNDGDELLPNVEVEAVQSNRSATSNDQGIAFLANIPKGRLTDIKIDAETLEDPYWLSSYSGLSLRPRPGVVTRIDFPIVTSGEIDGTLFLQKPSLAKKFPARQFTLNLSTPEGRIVQSTQSAYDGFYIFDSVPPGAYYMTISSKDLHQTKYTAPLPELLYIEPSGTTIFGKDLTLNKGLPIDYQFTVTNKQELYHKAVHPAPDSAHAEIAIGQYKSRLSMMLAWYKFKMKSNQLSHKLELATPIAKIQRHPETHLYNLKIQPISKRTLSLQSAYKICSHITSLNISCTVNIISNYNSVTASKKT